MAGCLSVIRETLGSIPRMTDIKRVYPNLVLTLPHSSLLFSTFALLVLSASLCP